MRRRKKKISTESKLSVYARIRDLHPHEPQNVTIRVPSNNKIEHYISRVWKSYEFKTVFKPASTNEQCFKVIAMPMIGNVLKGMNVILITYGQIGSGKSYSILGKPQSNISGILPQMLHFIIKQKTVKKVELSAIEAFGIRHDKIFLFDLYDKENQTENWSLKKGLMTLNNAKTVEIYNEQTDKEYIIYGFIRQYIKLFIPVEIINICALYYDITDAFLYNINQNISSAHSASHFAPICKNNLQSSRGHIAYITKIYQNGTAHNMNQNIIISHFIIIDCAGTQGIDVITSQFKTKVTPETLLCRKLEVATINIGLTQLQQIFFQLRRRGKLSKNVGYGLRNVLHSYINTKTYISVLFTISPSIKDTYATESTFKFAVGAGLIKVRPIICGSKFNWKTLVYQMREIIQQQEEHISYNYAKLNKIICTIEEFKKGDSSHKLNDSLQNEETKILMNELSNEEFKKRDSLVLTNEETKILMNELSNELKHILIEKTRIYPQMQILTNVLDEESDEEKRQLALEEYSKITIPWRKEAFIAKTKRIIAKTKRKIAKKTHNKCRNKVINIDEQIESQSDYQRLQQRHKELTKILSDPNGMVQKGELVEHAMELQILLFHEKCITKELQQSKQNLIDFTKDDDREALLRFLPRMRRTLT